MNWQPIETAPLNIPVLIYGLDYLDNQIITGGKLDEYGWDILGCGGYECETEITPTHWMLRPELPNK